MMRAMTMPSRFGSVAKVYIVQDEQLQAGKDLDPNTQGNAGKDLPTANTRVANPLALNMYVLGYNPGKKLVTLNNVVKRNLATYLSEYRPVTDAVNIKDAFIINIGIKYEIILRPSASAREILLECTNVLKEYFRVTKWSINQPINISKLYTLLDRVKGVQTVQNIEVVNKAGGNYSQYAYDIKGATRNNIVYPSYDPCIFEVKFPNTDIEGRITSL